METKMTIYPNGWEPECGAIFDGKYDVDIEDQFRILLILAYVQLSVPVLTLISSCLQARMEGSKYSLSSNILGLASIAGASCFLSFYYIDWEESDKQLYSRLFQSHIGISLGISCAGGLILVLFFLYLISQLICQKCELGNRAKSLVSFVCATTVLCLLIAAPVGSVILGYKYAFKGCESALDCIAVDAKSCLKS